MKTVLIALLFTGATIMPAAVAGSAAKAKGQNQSVADRGGRPQGAVMSVEEKRGELVQHIMERIANSQAELVCVKSAQSHDELKGCRERYRPKKLQDDGPERMQPPAPER